MGKRQRLFFQTELWNDNFCKTDNSQNKSK